MLNLTRKVDLQILDKSAALSEVSICNIWKIIKSSHRHNKFKISATTCDELLDGPYSVSDNWDCFLNIIKKYETLTNKYTNSHTRPQNCESNYIQIKTGYYLELLTPETSKVPGSIERRIRKGKNGENLSQLEITEVVLVHCKLLYLSVNESMFHVS